MLTEQWIKWEPIPSLSTRYSFKECIDHADGPRILLTDEYKTLEIAFEKARVFSYKKTLLKIRDLKINGISDTTEWAFFRVINSTFSQSLADGSYGFYLVSYFNHFAFITADAVIEVVCGGDPSVEIIEMEQ